MEDFFKIVKQAGSIKRVPKEKISKIVKRAALLIGSQEVKYLADKFYLWWQLLGAVEKKIENCKKITSLIWFKSNQWEIKMKNGLVVKPTDNYYEGYESSCK